MAGQRLGIIGVGGTGSYVLDFVAKTPVREIHLFDDDVFSQHNAFRSPGAASLEELQTKPKKAVYFREKYSRMHRGIVAVDARIGSSNVELLRQLDFVFLCLDKGGAKAAIIEALEETGVPFIDVGMGVELIDGALLGVLRVTTSTAVKRDHVREKNRIHLSDRENDDDYARNIQIAELNALNAALAVIRWKKLLEFYHDPEREHHCTYTIDGNCLINEDQA
jgi:tRNA A37 threonylcarbamoyladenosine dehydratase